MKELLLDTWSIQGVGTFGRLTYLGQQLAVSVERDWQSNRKNVSCVPAGLYELVPHHSGRFGDVYALVNSDLGVTLNGQSQRTHCYIHAANFPHELQGCIAFGSSWHPTTWGVADSKHTTADVYSFIKRNPDIKIRIVRR